MKISKLLTLALVVLFSISCSAEEDEMVNDDNTFREKIDRSFFHQFHSGKPFFLSKKWRIAKELYNAVYGKRTKKVKELLEAGADPNYCRGEYGWADSNPLNVVSEGLYDTYYQSLRGEDIPNPPPDIVVFNMLLNAGADIHSRPYVWNRVYNWNNKLVIHIKNEKKADGQSYTIDEIDVHIENFVYDSNRILAAFLEAGADPDMPGHPYPYSYEAIEARINDEEAKEYFKNGSRAINIAIEKGFIWESQVDLLLKFTKLDEESLDAAKRSGDPKMIEKIERLWEESQK